MLTHRAKTMEKKKLDLLTWSLAGFLPFLICEPLATTGYNEGPCFLGGGKE